MSSSTVRRGLCWLFDAHLPETFVNRLELVVPAKDDPIEFPHVLGCAVQPAGVSQWWKEKPQQRQVKSESEREDLLRVELPSPVTLVGAFNAGNAGLGEALTNEPLQKFRSLLLGEAPQLPGGSEVVSDDLVQVGLSRAGRSILANLFRRCPSASNHGRSLQYCLATIGV